MKNADWEIINLRYKKDGQVYPFPLEPDENFEIHSVRRLSDMEVFTTGDKTKCGTITAFRIKNGFMWVDSHDTPTNYSFMICDCKKVQQPQPPVDTDAPFQWTDELVKEFILTECNKYNTWDGKGIGLSMWFEKFKQSKSTPKQEDNKVQSIGFNWGRHPENELYKGEPPFSHVFYTDKEIPESKQEAIKKAIEETINNGQQHKK